MHLVRESGELQRRFSMIRLQAQRRRVSIVGHVQQAGVLCAAGRAQVAKDGAAREMKARIRGLDHDQQLQSLGGISPVMRAEGAGEPSVGCPALVRRHLCETALLGG